MKRTAKKIEEFLIGQKVDQNLVTNCNVDFGSTNILNPFSMFSKGGKGTMRCDFSKGDESLGNIDMHFNLTKNGLNTRIETSKGILGVLARESNIISEALDI